MSIRVKASPAIEILGVGDQVAIGLRSLPLGLVKSFPYHYERHVKDQISNTEARLIEESVLYLEPESDGAQEDVGFVVPTRDPNPCDLKRTLASIRKFSTCAPLVVVDDGSKNGDEVLRLTRSYGGSYVRIPTPHGPGFARNTGAATLINDIIVFVDSDVEFESRQLSTVLALFEAQDVVASAPRILSKSSRSATDLFRDTHFELDMGPVFASVPSPYVPYLPSATLCVRRGAFEESGGFDPTLFLGEDVDLVLRLHRLGRIYYLPSATFFHKDTPNPLRAFEKSFRYGLSYSDLHKKHRDRVHTLPLTARDRAIFIGTNLLIGPDLTAIVKLLLRLLRILAHAKRLGVHLDRRGIEIATKAAYKDVFREISELWLRVWILPLVLASLFSTRCRRFLLLSASIKYLRWRSKTQEPFTQMIASDIGYSFGVITSLVLGAAQEILA